MSCNAPLYAYRGRKANPETGKVPMVFKPTEAGDYQITPLPCGKCPGCRKSKASDWQTRIVCEAQTHAESCFVTLTYRPEDLPTGGVLVKRHLQLFLKRLRKRYGKGIKFYAVGAYGGKFGRPHYHVMLFGVSFGDLELIKGRKNKSLNLYRTPALDQPRPGKKEKPLWPYGFSSVGSLSEASAAYVANYLLDQEMGPQGAQPPFAVMSRGGKEKGSRGLGAAFLAKYKTDVYPKDYIMIGNRKKRPPRYFDYLLEKDDPDMIEDIKRERRHHAMKHAKTIREQMEEGEFLKVTRYQIRRAKTTQGD